MSSTTAEKEKHIEKVKSLQEKLHSISMEVANFPCDYLRDGKNCFDQESMRPMLPRRPLPRPFHLLNCDMMCSSCAAYWLITRAEQRLQEEHKTATLILAEEGRSNAESTKAG